MSPETQISPPKFALKFFRWFFDDLMIEGVEGDLCEIHHIRAQENPKRANRLFILDVLLLFRPGMIKNLLNSNSINNAMLQNHFKIAFRHA